MAKISQEITALAARNLAAHENYQSMGNHLRFWKFVNQDFRLSNFKHSTLTWELPEATVHKIQMLAGPHHRAIIKAMKINGASCELNKEDNSCSG
jgi:hypothetical protein